MEAYEHHHVGVVGQVSAISNDNGWTKREPSVLLELNESKNIEQTLAVAVTINELYQRTGIKRCVKRVTPSESLPLMQLLPAALVDDMYVKAVKKRDGPAWSTRPKLFLPFIEA